MYVKKCLKQLNQHLQQLLETNKDILIVSDAESLYRFAMAVSESIYPRIETGYAFYREHMEHDLFQQFTKQEVKRFFLKIK